MRTLGPVVVEREREREREEEVKQCLIEQRFLFLTRDVLRMYGGKIIVAEY